MPNALRQRPRCHHFPTPLRRQAVRVRQPLLHWPTLAAAVACAVMLVGGCLVWVARNPRPQVVVTLPAPAAPVPRPAEPPAPAALAPTVKIYFAPAAAPPPLAAQKEEEEDSKTKVSSPCLAEKSRPARQNYGTALSFVEDPLEAARQAGVEDRVLFLLHVSGNFEESCFT